MKLSDLPWLDQVRLRKCFYALPEDVTIIEVQSGTVVVRVPTLPLVMREPEPSFPVQDVRLWQVYDSDIIAGWDGSQTLFMWRRP